MTFAATDSAVVVAPPHSSKGRALAGRWSAVLHKWLRPAPTPMAPHTGALQVT